MVVGVSDGGVCGIYGKGFVVRLSMRLVLFHLDLALYPWEGDGAEVLL